MNKPYQLVVFDWEGTLADNLGQVFKCIDVEAARLNLGTFDTKLARQSVELGLAKAIKIIYPDISLHLHEQLLSSINQSLASRSTEVYLFPGAKEIIDSLSNLGIYLAVATNKGQQSLQRALQSTGLSTSFNTIRCAGLVPAKPCPQMLEEILDELNVSPHQTLMVGDSVTDIEMAQQIGVDAVAVDFYHQYEPMLSAAGALEVFDDYNELLYYIKNIEDNV